MARKVNIHSNELYFFKEENEILEKKYRDIWIKSDYPELFLRPDFLEYVIKHTPNHYTLTQETLNSLFDSYKIEMEWQLKKKVIAVKLYKLLMYSSMALLIISLFSESWVFMLFCIFFMAIFNFISPKDFI